MTDQAEKNMQRRKKPNPVGKEKPRCCNAGGETVRGK